MGDRVWGAHLARQNPGDNRVTPTAMSGGTDQVTRRLATQTPSAAVARGFPAAQGAMGG